ncbi:MAG TPA: 3-oxoacyl-ACP reductase family protein [Burkholderiales bacterium]|jgi:NAD(P)-dependent dehydrogenase (short-subunit alcohol dehydrogenase family)
MERLKGKVAVVTGGASGIGRAIALRLARDGASVVIADLHRFDQAAAEIAQACGTGTLGLEIDVSRESDAERMAAEAVKAFGRIDVLVNNAAVFSSLELRPFQDIPVEEFRRVMEVNILGVWLCCRACVPHMRRGGYGRIVNLASGAPLKGVPLFLHYISSKGAVIAMTRGLARELGKDAITVNALAPGFTLSENVAKHEMHVRQGELTRKTRAIQRDEKPEDLVGTVSFLASEDAAFLTGQTIVVDGGSVML